MDGKTITQIFYLLILCIIIVIQALVIIYFFRQCKDVKEIKMLLINKSRTDIYTSKQIEELQKENQLLKQQNNALYQQNQVLMNAFEMKKQENNLQQ